MASRTASAPCPARAGPFFSRGVVPCPSIGGRWCSIVQRAVRSTRVPIAERLRPMIGCPSPCPGAARSSASAGRSPMRISAVTNGLPRPRVRLRGTRNARLPRAPCQTPSPAPASPVTSTIPRHRRAGDRSTASCNHGTRKAILHIGIVAPGSLRVSQLSGDMPPLRVPLSGCRPVVKVAATRCTPGRRSKQPLKSVHRQRRTVSGGPVWKRSYTPCFVSSH